MAKISVLIEGYADLKPVNGVYHHNCTSVLIESGNKKIVFDPGLDREALLKRLQEHGLTVDEITHVFLSHNHIDHCMLMGIFTNAKVCTSLHYYDSRGYMKMSEKVLGSEVKMVHTPGHLKNHYALIVKDEKGGKVLLAGDLWWWAKNEQQELDYTSLIEKDDYFGRDLELTKESRRKMLEIVDEIIPGHGKRFKNPRKERN